MALINVDSWILEYDSVENLSREIQSQITQRNPTNFYLISSQIRVKIKQFANELAQLQRNLSDLGKSRSITRDEEERRIRQIENLQSKLVHMEKQFSEKPGDTERKELFSKGNSLWEGEEDEPILDTGEGVSNYMQRKDQILNQQEEQLENLAKTISRQKNIAIRIGEEVDTHNDILDNLGDQIENTDSSVINETRHVDRVSRRDSTCGYWIVIISLMIAIVLVGIL